MGNSNSQHRISAQDKAILDLKNQRDTLHRHQKKISHLSATYTASAKAALAHDNKPLALLFLRRKKYQESLLAQTDRQLEQLERLVGSVEFALVQKDVLFGLKRGTEVLTEVQREMGGLEGVERLLSEGEEARAFQRELSETLAGRMSNADEDEVEEELEAMEAQLSGALPDVPTKAVPAKERARAREERRRREEAVAGEREEEREAIPA